MKNCLAKNKITIITPCFNARKDINQTIQSVVHQSAIAKNIVELEYIIVDGKSNDGTIDIIENAMIKYHDLNKKIKIKVISEPDNGMYDALVKGLKMSTGNICAYINADDFYYNTAFEVVINGMQINNNIRWLTGFNVQYNIFSQITNVNLPYRYRNQFIKKKAYGKILPFIQQESTFWDYELNALLDMELLANLKLAGDYYLWNKFSNEARLYIVQSLLAGFRIRDGQLSEELEKYFMEMDLISKESVTLFDRIYVYLDNFITRSFSNTVKRYLNKDIIYFDHKSHQWKLDQKQKDY